MFPAAQECMPDFPTLTLEHLATAVILLDDEARVVYLNPAAEHLFDVSGKNLLGHPVQQAFTDTGQLTHAMQHAIRDNASYIEHDLTLGTHAHGRLHLRCAVTPVQLDKQYLLLEFHPMDRPLKLAREEQMLDQTQASRLLLRNLAHEITRTRSAAYAARRSCSSRNWKSRPCANTPRSSCRRRTGCVR